MNPAGHLTIAQFMAAAAFFTVALMHLLVWSRRHARVHLLFALTTLFAGGFAIAEAWFYRAATVDAFNVAFKWSNTFGAAWAIALTWFVVTYTGTDKIRRWLPVTVSTIFGIAMLVNVLAPYGFLFAEIIGLREIMLPWGERMALAEGTDSPWRFATDLAQIGILFLVIDGSMRLWRQGERRRAWLLGSSLSLFMVCFGIYAMLVDIGLLSFPYLTSYGFLTVTLAVSYDLAGEVVRASVLAREVAANERRWRLLLESVHLLAAGVDRRGRIDYINPFFTEVSGFSAAELIGRPVIELLPASEQPRFQQAFGMAMAGESQPRVEVALHTKDGAQRSIVWFNVVLRDTAGEVTGILSIGADVTERRQAETARDLAMKDLQQALQEVDALKSRLQDEVVHLQDEIKSDHNFEEISGRSDALKYVLHKIEQVASLDTTVLIEGETGVGKELVARALHNFSPRKERALIKVNCAALPANLIEAELFGHEKGAFTGADKARKGRFEVADGGTLFLDEVGELPLELQPKLLRALQEGEVERLGGNGTLHIDVRVIAATNRRLQEAVKQGRFREDLYYRLNVYPITVPPLRQRKDDIPLLANAFVNKCARAQGKRIETIPQPVMEQLLRYDWPGNIRELENVIERAVITTTGPQLRLAEALIDELEGEERSDDYQGTLAEVEHDYIIRILELSGWRIEGKQGAAERLDLNPGTLRARMRKLGIKRPQQQRY